MRTFIQEILELIKKDNKSVIKDYCFVFPTKRACNAFKVEMAQNFKTGLILPNVITINDFICQETKNEPSDEIILISKLFEVYTDVFKETKTHSFDTFFAYGKQLLKEFDEIDRYILNAEKVFTYIENLEQIGSSLELDEEKLKYLKEFWSSYHTNEEQPKGVKKEFSDEWKLLATVYKEFNNKLEAEGLSYEGMLYRKLTIYSEKSHFTSYSKLYFCGFNAFSIAERRIINALQKTTEVKLIFDIDEYYTKNQSHIAGNFFRENLEKFNNDKLYLIKSNLFESKKEIEFVECKNDVSQIIYLIQKLNSQVAKKTTIILNDESLLPQLFNFNFSNWDNVNISMGYPLVKTNIYKLIDEIKSLFITSKVSNQTRYIYKKQLINLFNNKLFDSIENKKINDFRLELERNNAIYVSVESLKEGEFKTFYNLLIDSKSFISAFSSFLEEINNHSVSNTIEKIAIEKIRERIEEVDNEIDILKTCSNDADTTLQFVQEILTSIKITFDTNPNADIQIMGLLETRGLDFENIIVLSCNESYLPGDNLSKFSFIPYLVRKSFDLPTADEFNAIYSYHFFRLLQRAENIQLLYVKESVSNAQEESRFIMQLMSDEERLKNINFTHHFLTIKNSDRTITSAGSIKKVGTAKENLIKYSTGEKAFSPSSISLFIRNPFEFGLKYGFNIYGANDESEEIDHLLFGSILHKCIELLYAPHIGKTIDKDLLTSIDDNKRFDEVINESFSESNVITDINLVGVKNKILADSIKQILKGILDADKQRLPFKVIGLEKAVEFNYIQNNGNIYKIKGTIDRIDEKDTNGVKSYHIIDYKTGKVDLKIIEDKDVEKYFTVARNYNLQGMIYAMLLRDSTLVKNEAIEVFFYGIREKTYHPLNKNLITNDLMDNFKEQLLSKIDEIVNLENPFIANEKDKYKETSDYAELLPS